MSEMCSNPTNKLKWPSRRKWLAGTVAALLFTIISVVLAASDYRYRFSKGFDLIGIVLFSTMFGIAVGLWCMTWRRRAIANTYAVPIRRR